jgi:hypothetical protein
MRRFFTAVRTAAVARRRASVMTSDLRDDAENVPAFAPHHPATPTPSA